MSVIKLYHGSQKIIEAPTCKGGKIYNDYGQGFYCTRHIDLAKEWAVDEDSDGYVNVYELEMKGLRVLNLNDDKYSILHWLTILLEHRAMRMGGPVADEGMEFLKNNYHLDISEFDVIVGYRADDSYFSFARAFVSNSISINQLKQAMYLGELGEQYFIKSEKAFSDIKFVEAIPVESAGYYPLKNSRDNKARQDFFEISGTMDKSGIYLIDLVRKESENGTSL